MKNTPLNRRQSLAVLGSTLALPSAVWAQPGWKPTQTINYVIGVAAGGSVDLYARGIKSALETLNLVNGQTVTDSDVSIGDRIGVAAMGVGQTVGGAAGLALSAPLAVIDPKTRRTYQGQVEQFGRAVSGTVEDPGAD